MDKIRSAVNAVGAAFHSHEAVRHLIAAEAPEKIRRPAYEFQAGCIAAMNSALEAMPAEGPERPPRLGDFPMLEKRPYSALHWCVIEYCEAEIVRGKEWEAGENPEKASLRDEGPFREFFSDDDPVPQEQIDEYRVRVKFAEYLADWKSEFLP